MVSIVQWPRTSTCGVENESSNLSGHPEITCSNNKGLPKGQILDASPKSVAIMAGNLSPCKLKFAL